MFENNYALKLNKMFIAKCEINAKKSKLHPLTSKRFSTRRVILLKSSVAAPL